MMIAKIIILKKGWIFVELVDRSMQLKDVITCMKINDRNRYMYLILR